MESFGVAIIGTGWVAGEHVKAFSSNPHAEVKIICGRDQARTQAFVDAQAPGAKAVTDINTIVNDDSINIVAIATPPDCHREQALAIAQAGKHILLEKAMATSLDDARAIRDAVADAGVKSVVSFVLRWNPLFELIKSQLADDSIGRVFLGEVDYFHGIGPWYQQYGWNIKKEIGVSSLLSAGCHAVDALRWFMGGDVVEVMQYSTASNGVDYSDYEYHPTSCTICKFADGRVGKVTSCIESTQPYVFNINLVGTHGTIKNNKIWSKTKFPGQTDWVTTPTILPDSGDVSHHPFTDEATHLIDCIRFDKESHASIADAFKTHEICYAADLSGIEGRPVQIPMG